MPILLKFRLNAKTIEDITNSKIINSKSLMRNVALRSLIHTSHLFVFLLKALGVNLITIYFTCSCGYCFLREIAHDVRYGRNLVEG